MTFGFDCSSYEAVFFVEDNRVVREMLFNEFEAMLDGMFYDPDFKNSMVQAAYVKIDKRLDIVAAVFFTLGFDEEGQADKHWNVPLMQLAESAAFGNRLNTKGVRIACHSQCQITWQQEHLWEPDLNAEPNILHVLADTVKVNRLGLLASESDSALSQPVQQIINDNSDTVQSRGGRMRNANVSDIDIQNESNRKRSARFMRQLRGRVNRFRKLHKQDTESLRADAVQKERVLMDKLDDCERKLFALQVDCDHKSSELQRQSQDYETQLEEALQKHANNHEKLRRQLRQDLQQRLIEETSELQAKLDMREVEVHYREEQISRLQEQLAEQMRVDGKNTQSVATFNELERSGLRYYIELEGVEPIPVSADRIASYHASPERYVADYLSMDFEIYKRWSGHASHPVCSAKVNDASCSKMVEISSPQTFIAGVSDRCSEHQIQPAVIAKTG